MSETYQHKLQELADLVGITVDDVQACLYEAVPFTKHLTFQRDAIYQKLYNSITIHGDGVFYCIIDKTNRPQYEITPVNDYVGQIFKAISQQVSQLGYKAFYRCSNQYLADEAYFEALLAKYPDAGIICIVPYKFDQLASVCKRLNRPLLILDYEDASQAFYTLSIDNQHGIQEITAYLIGKGHRRIAHLTGQMAIQSAQDRFAGYQTALEKAGIPFNPEWVKYGDWQSEMGEALVAELLQCEPRPTALVCANDASAMGAYSAIFKAGLNIPEDLSVTGFDDIPLATNCHPPLTTVRQPIKEIGQRAAQSIINIMEGKPVSKNQKFQNLLIIERASVRDLSG